MHIYCASRGERCRIGRISFVTHTIVYLLCKRLPLELRSRVVRVDKRADTMAGLFPSQASDVTVCTSFAAVCCRPLPCMLRELP